MQILSKNNESVVFVIPDDPTTIPNSPIVIADLGTVGTSAPITGVVWAAHEDSGVSKGDRVLFERGTGLWQNTSDISEHEKMILIGNTHILAVIDSDTVADIK